MFDIGYGDEGRIVMAGRLDASQAEKATRFLDRVDKPSVVDMQLLEYISSLGLGVLLRTQKRLQSSAGGGLRLVGVGKHLADVFRFSGFDHVFDIELAD